MGIPIKPVRFDALMSLVEEFYEAINSPIEIETISALSLEPPVANPPSHPMTGVKILRTIVMTRRGR